MRKGLTRISRILANSKRAIQFVRISEIRVNAFPLFLFPIFLSVCIRVHPWFLLFFVVRPSLFGTWGKTREPDPAMNRWAIIVVSLRDKDQRASTQPCQAWLLFGVLANPMSESRSVRAFSWSGMGSTSSKK